VVPEGRVALVSGGSGAIGSAICRALARDGADVAFTWYRHEETASRLAAEIEALGRHCVHAGLEAGDEAAIDSFVARVEASLGSVDILVNNLGATQILPFALIEVSDWDLMVGVNLKSMFLFTRAVARGMIRRRRGAIVNLGSIAGRRLLEVPVHYATAKAGVTGFTTSLAKELSRYNIRVNEVAPGLIEGGIGANASQRQVEEYTRYCALHRSGRPEEVAELVAFLASERASYINAQSVVIDGGL
jgi:NAD(P)-dependent dehydrogenase (short-subunit alcohol dehydrogenase family)